MQPPYFLPHFSIIFTAVKLTCYQIIIYSLQGLTKNAWIWIHDNIFIDKSVQLLFVLILACSITSNPIGSKKSFLDANGNDNALTINLMLGWYEIHNPCLNLFHVVNHFDSLEKKFMQVTRRNVKYRMAHGIDLNRWFNYSEATNTIFFNILNIIVISYEFSI